MKSKKKMAREEESEEDDVLASSSDSESVSSSSSEEAKRKRKKKKKKEEKKKKEKKKKTLKRKKRAPSSSSSSSSDDDEAPTSKKAKTEEACMTQVTVESSGNSQGSSQPPYSYRQDPASPPPSTQENDEEEEDEVDDLERKKPVKRMHLEIDSDEEEEIERAMFFEETVTESPKKKKKKKGKKEDENDPVANLQAFQDIFLFFREKLVDGAEANDYHIFRNEIEAKKQHALFKRHYKEITTKYAEANVPSHCASAHAMFWRVADFEGLKDGSGWENCDDSDMARELTQLYKRGWLPRYKPPEARKKESQAKQAKEKAVERAMLNAFDTDDIESAPPPRAEPNQNLTVAGLCKKYGLNKLEDVLSYAEGTAYNLYVKEKKRRPERAMNDNVEYECYIYKAEDEELLTCALFRALVTLAGKVSEMGASNLASIDRPLPRSESHSSRGTGDDERGRQRSRSPATRKTSPLRTGTSMLPPAPSGNILTNPNFNGSVHPAFNLPGANMQPGTGGGALTPDPPGRVRVGTILDEMGVTDQIKYRTDIPNHYEVLKKIRMVVGGRMRRRDQENRFDRPKEGGYFVYTEEDRQAIKDCVREALSELQLQL